MRISLSFEDGDLKGDRPTSKGRVKGSSVLALVLLLLLELFCLFLVANPCFIPLIIFVVALTVLQHTFEGCQRKCKVPNPFSSTPKKVPDD